MMFGCGTQFDERLAKRSDSIKQIQFESRLKESDITATGNFGRNFLERVQYRN